MVDVSKTNLVSQISNSLSDIQLRRKPTKEEKKANLAALKAIKTLGSYKQILTKETALTRLSKDVSWVETTYNQVALSRINR